MPYTYKCADYPGMEECPGTFTVETQDELWQHIELHGATAHDEDPSAWSEEERRQIREVIRRT